MSHNQLHNEKLLKQKINEQNKSKSFKCDICFKLFRIKSLLTRHYRTHTGEKPFACQVCDKKFAYNSTLIQHQAIHTGEKPFACNLCDKKFTQKSNLVQHQATHSDVKTFKCSICAEGKFFKTKKDLKQHMVRHYEPKYCCSYCDHKSYTKNELSRHEKRHIKN